MKNFYKFLGIITILAVIGFSVIGCSTGDDGSNNSGNNSSGNNSGGNNTGGNNNSGGTAPSAPTGVTATATSSTSIQISWNAVSGATSYNVYYATSSSGTYYLDGTSITTSFTSTGWGTSETGYFKVTAVNSAGESSQSSTVSATTQSSSSGGNNNGGGTAPSAPTGVTATALSSSSISVSWSAVSGATSYKVYYEIGSSTTKNLAGTVTGTSYTHTGLQASTTYYYYIKAVNSAGESDYSSYGYAATQSSSSGGGGGTIEYRLDQPIFGTCSKSGNNLTINWTLNTSGKTPNGLYTYTSPSNIIIQVYDGSSFDNIQTLSATARTFTLNNFAVYQYSPAGVSGNRVTIRVYCTSGSSSYDSKYSTTTYLVESNYWSPTY